MAVSTVDTRPEERKIVKWTLLFTSTFTVMAGAIVSPALRDMQVAFAAVENVDFWVRLVLTVPALFIVIGAPVAGWIVDRYGRKRLLLFSTILYGIAGGSGLIAPTLPLILVGRALLGIAVAGLMTSVTTLITDYYTGERRPKFLGLQAGVMGFASTIALTVSGIVVALSWRAPFGIYLLAFAAAPLVALVLYEPKRPATPPVSPPLADPGDCMAEIERCKADPEPPREQTPVGLLAFIYGTLVIVQIVFYLIPVEFSFYLNALVGAEGGEAGLALAAMTLFYAIGSLSFGRFIERFSHIQILTVALALVGLGYLAIGSASGWLLVIIGLPVAGFGLGITVPNLNVWVANSVPDALRGRALGLFATSLFLGQFLSPLVAQPITLASSASTTFALAGLTLLVAAGIRALMMLALTHRPAWIARLF
ncbi:MAG: MFS transporter [Chloroflexi bacterium]|nr:MFS transporter [Chloroflexota bacterium]